MPCCTGPSGAVPEKLQIFPKAGEVTRSGVQHSGWTWKPGNLKSIRLQVINYVVNQETMIKPLFYNLIWLMAIWLIACTSPLSSENITDLSLINADIEITQNPGDKKANTVIVILQDKKGRRISNDSITIMVNGVEASLSHRQGLYYTNESGYALSDVPVNDAYKVEIKLPDQTVHFLGSVNALQEEKTANISCNERGELNQDFTISWQGLKDIDELSVFVSQLQKNSPANEKNYSYRPEK